MAGTRFARWWWVGPRDYPRERSMNETDPPKDQASREQQPESPSQKTSAPDKGTASPLVPSAQEKEAPAEAAKPAAPPAKAVRRPSLLQRIGEPEEVPIDLPTPIVRARTRRDFLLFGAGTVAAAAGFWWVLPDGTKQEHLTRALRDWLDSVEGRVGLDRARRERFLNRALTFDDDVAEALYSPTRSVRTYSKSAVTPLRNNYNGATPRPDYIPGWTLAV